MSKTHLITFTFLIIVLISGTLLRINQARSLLISSFFKINTIEHSIGGDDTFNFHVTRLNQPYPVSFVEDFTINTIGGVGSHSTSDPGGNNTIYFLTQSTTTGWQYPTIVCSSSNPLVTSSPIDHGVKIYGQAYSSINCDITNTKELSIAPIVSTSAQLKSDGISPITETGITAESTVVFKATLLADSMSQIKLQVELKATSQPFDETNLLESAFVTSGVRAVITKDSLTSGAYHWRARAMDDKGNTSAWQEFGVTGNTDFEVKLVPLYTQVRSNFPSDGETRVWSEKLYAAGRGNLGPIDQRCGLNIANCGCAITSMVMLGRYYGINTSTDGMSVDPSTVDKWLLSHNGYTSLGKVYWSKVIDYLGFVDQTTNKKMVRFIFNPKTDWNTSSTSPRISSYLNSGQPIVAYNDKARHYLIIDNKLSGTYTTKDPAWYNTKTLNDTQNYNNHVRGYGNYFKTANIFTYLETPKLATASMQITLSSPAELLIIDPQGRKLGRDPITNLVYDEIPEAAYVYDGPIVTSDTDIDPSQIHETKEINIEAPLDGQYQLQVVGTGAGSFGLELTSFDLQGNSKNQQFNSETIPGHVTPYVVSFDSTNSTNTITKIADNIPPEAEIAFNTSTRRLVVYGRDNVTISPGVSTFKQDEKTVYQIKDEAGNTTKLVFGKIEQKNREIKAKLQSIQYNDNTLIVLPETELNFEWSANNGSGELKELEQKIESKDTFEIMAKYNREKNETEVKIKIQDKKETNQTLPGLVIIKLISKSGVLGFEY